MKSEKIKERLAFLREAEELSCLVEDAHSVAGIDGSSLEQSWRLCLMAIALDELAEESDLLLLTGGLDEELRASLLALWDAHENAPGAQPSRRK